MNGSNSLCTLQDSEKNRIKQWKESQLNTGIFSAELPLSEAPVLGDWTITAEVGEEVIYIFKYQFALYTLHFI